MIIGSSIIHLQETGSTNTYAAGLIKKDTPAEGTVIHADFQDAGRGHQGNKWVSESGKNLLFSIILYPQAVDPSEQFLISVTTSLGILDFLRSYIKKGCSVKWPNDLYYADDKIAGILIENSLMGNAIEHSVAGIGININQKSFPADLQNATSLALITGKEHDRERCLGELLGCIDLRYRQMLYGNRKDLVNDYTDNLYRAGEFHIFRASCGIFSGKITGISSTGKLIITTRENRKLEFGFKELEYEI